MASITSPEQGAQQLCSSTFFSPPGGTRTGRSNWFATSLMGGRLAQSGLTRELGGRVGDLPARLHQHLVRLPHGNPDRVAGPEVIDLPARDGPAAEFVRRG